MTKRNKQSKRAGKASERKRKTSTTADILGGTRGRPATVNQRPHHGKWSRHYQHLMALREELLKQSAELAKEGSQEMARGTLHPADTASDSFERDFALSVLSFDQEALFEIEEALKRIESGTYGICEITGRPISQRRLEVIPWTRFSVEAASQLEQEGALARTHLGAAGKVAEGVSLESEESDDAEETSAAPAG